MRWVLVIIMFFLLGALFIISNEDLSFKKMENVDVFYKSYIGWMGKVVGNVGTITGNMIKLEWAPNQKK